MHIYEFLIAVLRPNLTRCICETIKLQISDSNQWFIFIVNYIS